MSASEAVRVAVRCRPLNGREKRNGNKVIVQVDSSVATLVVTNPEDSKQAAKAFTFDAVYGPEETQQSVYEETGFPLVESLFDGFNCTIFAYGQTGCGKTHTMTGVLGDAELQGVIPRSFQQVFATIDSMPETEFLVRVARPGWVNGRVGPGTPPRCLHALPDMSLSAPPGAGVFPGDLQRGNPRPPE